MAATLTPAPARVFALQQAELRAILDQFGLDHSPELEAATAPVIALAGALMASNPEAVSQASDNLRAAVHSDEVLDFVSGLARVLVRHTPVVSQALQSRAPGFARLAHPAGVRALLDGDLDLFAA